MDRGAFVARSGHWAMADAYDLHQQIGKNRTARRTHALAPHLKVERALDAVRVLVGTESRAE
jgi:hypothetical protein